MNHWDPILYENRNLVPASTDPNYHLTTDLADKAIAWVRQATSISPEKPYFLYVATGATHAPHHTPKEWIDKFKGKFDEGWDKYREADPRSGRRSSASSRKNTQLTVRSEGLPAWDSLNADQKRLYARMMEVFAGYARALRSRVGPRRRCRQAAPRQPTTPSSSTSPGDNGASAEGGLEGSLCENAFFNGFSEKWQDNIKAIDELGGPKHFNHFPSAWAHAMNTPFQWTKQVASHFGGTRNPMIVSWPARIKDKGGLRIPVPAHHRHRADALRALRNHRADRPERHAAEAHRGRQLRLHVQRRQGREPPQNAVLRARLQPRPLSRRMDGIEPILRSLGSEPRGLRSRQSAVGALQDRRGLLPGKRPGASSIPKNCASCRISGGWRPPKYNVLPLDWRATIRMNAEAMGRPSLIARPHRR